jgi:hypothetical protein
VAEARERWPAFARSARAAGVESFLSAPLFIDEKFAGSLNLYGRGADSFDDLDESLLRLYTAAAAAAIANARRYAEARRLAENLRRAIESRAVIDQAIGMLMATRGLDAEESFGCWPASRRTRILSSATSPPGSRLPRAGRAADPAEPGYALQRRGLSGLGRAGCQWPVRRAREEG